MKTSSAAKTTGDTKGPRFGGLLEILHEFPNLIPATVIIRKFYVAIVMQIGDFHIRLQN